jgi:predicted O-methyltransferase YrrM
MASITHESSFARAWEVANDIEGWLTEEQAAVLFDAARAVAAQNTIVEIGSHLGKSTVVLASARPEGNMVAVDPFDNPRWGGGPEVMRDFESNLRRAGVSGVQLRRTISEEAAADWTGTPIGMLYIDGAHDVDSVLKDIDLWRPYLASGAAVFIHDAFSSVGVTLAVLRRILPSRQFRYVGSERSLASFRYEHISIRGQVRKTLMMSARIGYFARNIAVKAAMSNGKPQWARMLGHDDEVSPY